MFFQGWHQWGEGKYTVRCRQHCIACKGKGIDGINSYQDIEKIPMQKRAEIAMAVSEPNVLVNSNWAGIVQLSSEKMDRFENIVMVVKDEEPFIKRVLEAVRKQGGECITGDVFGGF